MPPKISAPPGHKGCNDCLAVYPATSQYFSRDKTRKDGLMVRCRNCNRRRVTEPAMSQKLRTGRFVPLAKAEQRHIVMFSGGIASWAEAKLTVEKYGPSSVTLLFADTRIEDHDLYRFLHQAAQNVGAPLITVADGRTPWQVFSDDKYLGNSRSAQCSVTLKRLPTQQWLMANCSPESTVLHFGMDWEERHRAERAAANNAPYLTEALLCDSGLTRHQLYGWLAWEGLTRPRLYDLGFDHNNCGATCVKAGKGHWKKVLQLLPEHYAEAQRQEDALRSQLGDVSILSRGGIPLPLSTLRAETLTPLEMLENSGCGCFIDDAPEW